MGVCVCGCVLSMPAAGCGREDTLLLKAGACVICVMRHTLVVPLELGERECSAGKGLFTSVQRGAGDKQNHLWMSEGECTRETDFLNLLKPHLQGLQQSCQALLVEGHSDPNPLAFFSSDGTVMRRYFACH